MKRGRYTVVFEQDEEAAWIAWVPSIRGCHTYGLTLQSARERIREALSLWVDDAETAELNEQIRLPAPIRQTIRSATSARANADRASRVARDKLDRAVRELVRAGYSYRDIASLLGLSHQRIGQLVEGLANASTR